jgi:hypothetical protein
LVLPAEHTGSETWFGIMEAFFAASGPCEKLACRGILAASQGPQGISSGLGPGCQCNVSLVAHGGTVAKLS